MAEHRISEQIVTTHVAPRLVPPPPHDASVTPARAIPRLLVRPGHVLPRLLVRVPRSLRYTRTAGRCQGIRWTFLAVGVRRGPRVRRQLRRHRTGDGRSGCRLGAGVGVGVGAEVNAGLGAWLGAGVGADWVPKRVPVWVPKRVPVWVPKRVPVWVPEVGVGVGAGLGAEEGAGVGAGVVQSGCRRECRGGADLLNGGQDRQADDKAQVLRVKTGMGRSGQRRNRQYLTERPSVE